MCEDWQACGAAGVDPDAGLLMAATTNLYAAAPLCLSTKVKLPDGTVHLELSEATGEFTVWCMDHGSGEHVKLLDSRTSPTRDMPISAWRSIAGVSESGVPEVPVWITSSSPGSAKLLLRYWSQEGGLFMEDAAEQKITAYGFRFLTPAGDPVASPRESGAGQNEFTYDDPTESLAIALVVEVTPALPSSVVLSGSFSLPGIDGATLEWHDDNPGGSVSSELAEGANSIGHTVFAAQATYQGYPTNNFGFGRKTVTFSCNGETISQDFEVFFPKYGTHHPTCGTCQNCPNWFYYWREGGVCGINENCRYDGTSDYGWTSPWNDNWIRLGFKAARSNSGPETYTNTCTHGIITVTGQGKGIQCVAETIQHEQHHIDTYNRFHSQGNDPDGDGIPTSDEASYDGISSNPEDPDTYNLKAKSASYQSYGDDEVRCRKNEVCPEPGKQIPYYSNLDWANPGCQHKEQFGPMVQ